LSRKNNSVLLEYFLKNPTTPIYAGELEKKLKMSRQSMFHALGAVLDAGLLEVREIGRVRQYTVAKDNPVVKQLKILLSVNYLIPLLEKIKNSGVEVYLFGSAARGEDTEKSDTDILIVGDKQKNDVIGMLSEKEKLKPVYFTHLEYSAMARKDKPFYERIEKDKIRLI
jgi:predicted nucleotidyltransferase